jgi:hypothetical protein
VGIYPSRDLLLIDLPSPAREVTAWRSDRNGNDAIRTAGRCKSPCQHQGEARRISEGDAEHMLSISEPQAPESYRRVAAANPAVLVVAGSMRIMANLNEDMPPPELMNLHIQY